MNRLKKEIYKEIAHIQHGNMESYHHGAVKAFETVLNKINELELQDKLSSDAKQEAENLYNHNIKISINS